MPWGGYFCQITSSPHAVEPKGAVPKKSKDEFRDISDTRTGKKTITKLGTLLFTAWDLASSMGLLSFLNCHDISYV